MKRILILCVVFLAAGSLAHADLFTNGSFETLNIGFSGAVVGPFAGLASANPLSEGKAQVYKYALADWTTGPAGVEVQTSGVLDFIDAMDGLNYLELDSHEGAAEYFGGTGNSNASITQSVVLDAGGIYEVSFYYAPRTDIVGSNGIGVFLDDALTPFFQVESTKSVWGGWQQVTGTFALLWDQGGTHSITFAGLGIADNFGGLIDMATLEKVDEIPEPATYGLVGMALMGLYFVRRRRAA